jgi:heat-inducible transcriptional repressor
MSNEELSEREKNILRFIIQQFILTATPVGSRNITKKYDIGVSPATVRNIMSDLEESGLIDHPHTSAGRVPTDKGYRFYVDSLMDIRKLKNSEKGFIHKNIEQNINETDELLKITSTLLSKITRQLACVSYPKLDTGILEKLQIVSLSSTKILVVISIKSGLVKTITLEVDSEVKISQITPVEQLLNERLTGLTLKEIRSTFRERFKDVDKENNSVIRLFYDSVDKIFHDLRSEENLFISGAKNVIRQPEFEDPEKFQSVIELIEDKDIIIHIMERPGDIDQNDIIISIGSENKDQKLKEYSVISKEYKSGEVSGTLGIIGPKRMEYSKIVAIVDYMARMLTEHLTIVNTI